MSVRVLAAGVLAMAVGACSEDKVRTVDPKAEWTYVPNARVTVVDTDARFDVDFGVVAIGARSTLVIEVKNEGGVPFTIPPIRELESGFTTDIPTAGLTVNVAQTATIEVSFAPTEETTYEWSGQLAVSDYADQSLSIELLGRGQRPQFTCDTDHLDFGNVLRNRSSKRTVSCHNGSQVDGVLIVQAIEGTNKALFSHSITGSNGRVAVGAGESLEISVTFRADGVPGYVLAKFEILLEVNDYERLPVTSVKLDGEIVAHAVTCEQEKLDFGYALPGSEKHATIACSNNASEPFEITNIQLDQTSSDRFTWTPADAPITIPPVENGVPGLLEIDVAFKPTTDDLGSRKSGVLIITSNDSTNPQTRVEMTGFAGGPVISCSPADIDFGVVPTALSATRTFVCFNDGTSDPDPSRVDDALLVTSVESTNPTEFIVTVRDGLKTGGYLADSNDRLVVDVVYKPVDDGPDIASIKIVSNDTLRSQEDPFPVAVRGHGRALADCDFDIIPPEIRFGIVDRGDSATLEFAIRNNSMDSECLIQNLRLAEGDDCNAFSLPSGDEVKTETLPPEGERRFPIRFSPPDYKTTPYTCEIRFDISNSEYPHHAVPVRGVSEMPCAHISPSSLDFGTVKKDCATRDREFQIINACSVPLVFRRLELNMGASENEFFIRSEPEEGYVIGAGLSTTFTIAYRPVDLTEDLGAVMVHVNNEGSEPYMATLRGKGSTAAFQIDTFEQTDQPKVDILWVIDNSRSMDDEQAAIGDNLTSFITYADMNEVDYQIGVTTTGLTPTTSSGCSGGASGGEDGRLFPVNRERPHILTRNTPHLQDVWAANFRVGTCHDVEKGMEAALRALSYPLINETKSSKHNSPYDDGNLGFLRKDAHLSIIEVTDEVDQSDQNVNFYYNAFLSIKGHRNSHLFNYHAITGPKDFGCTSTGAEPGNKLISLVEKTDGGVFQSICDPDWSVSLSKMSKMVFGFKTCFNLTSEPEDLNLDGEILDTTVEDGKTEITLLVNGKPFPAKGGQDGKQDIWYYSHEQTAVCFNPIAVPEANSQIEISYHVACREL